MESEQKKQPKTLKRFLKGMFQWQTVLVSSAFLAMFAFLIYIIGNIVAPFKFDMESVEYKALEQTYLIIFIVGVVSALMIAIFSAKMIDDPKFVRNLFSKKKTLKTAVVEKEEKVDGTAVLMLPEDVATKSEQKAPDDSGKQAENQP